MKNPSLLIVALSLAAVLSSARAAPTLHFTDAEPLARIPFELDNNHLYVEVTLKGGHKGSFMVDTDSTSTVYDTGFAKAAGVSLSANGDADPDQIAYARGQTLGLPGLDITDEDVQVMPFDGLSPIGGRRVDGVIGADILGLFTARIDYAAKLLTLYRPDSYRAPEGAATLPLKTSTATGGVMIPAYVTLPGQQPTAILCVVDTGSGGSNLNTPFVDTSGALKAVGTTIARPTYGASGTGTPALLARVSGLKLGPYALAEPLISLSRSKDGTMANSEFQCILGNDMLQRFTLTLDYHAMQLVLERNAAFGNPFKADASGLTLTAKADDLRQFEVYFVTPGSPAAEAGIKPGDVLETIDGVPVSRYRLGELKQFLLQDGTRHTLTLRRGTQRIQVQLQLRRLI